MFVKSSKSRIIKPVLVLVIIAVIIIAAVFSLRAYGIDMELKGLESAEHGLTRASLQCYALEGRYAPSYQYLCDNYGVAIDDSKYTVIYTYKGVNMMPDMKVFMKSEQTPLIED